MLYLSSNKKKGLDGSCFRSCSCSSSPHWRWTWCLRLCPTHCIFYCLGCFTSYKVYFFGCINSFSYDATLSHIFSSIINLHCSITCCYSRFTDCVCKFVYCSTLTNSSYSFSHFG